MTKKAIIAGLRKLPKAMGLAFKSDIIRKAFMDNDQIDTNTEELVPQFEGLAGTYHGNMSPDHFLTKIGKIVKTYYEELFFNGRIEESSFDTNNVPKDYDSLGNKVKCDFDIEKENCQKDQRVFLQKLRDNQESNSKIASKSNKLKTLNIISDRNKEVQ